MGWNHKRRRERPHDNLYCLYTKDLRSPVEGLGVTAQAEEVTRLAADTSE